MTKRGAEVFDMAQFKNCLCVWNTDQNNGFYKMRLIIPKCQIHGKDAIMVSDLTLNHEVNLDDQGWVRVSLLRMMDNGMVMLGFAGNGMVYVLVNGWLVYARKV